MINYDIDASKSIDRLPEGITIDGQTNRVSVENGSIFINSISNNAVFINMLDDLKETDNVSIEFNINFQKNNHLMFFINTGSKNNIGLKFYRNKIELISCYDYSTKEVIKTAAFYSNIKIEKFNTTFFRIIIDDFYISDLYSFDENQFSKNGITFGCQSSNLECSITNLKVSKDFERFIIKDCKGNYYKINDGNIEKCNFDKDNMMEKFNFSMLNKDKWKEMFSFNQADIFKISGISNKLISKTNFGFCLDNYKKNINFKVDKILHFSDMGSDETGDGTLLNPYKNISNFFFEKKEIDGSNILIHIMEGKYKLEKIIDQNKTSFVTFDYTKNISIIGHGEKTVIFADRNTNKNRGYRISLLGVNCTKFNCMNIFFKYNASVSSTDDYDAAIVNAFKESESYFQNCIFENINNEEKNFSLIRKENGDFKCQVYFDRCIFSSNYGTEPFESSYYKISISGMEANLTNCIVNIRQENEFLKHDAIHTINCELVASSKLNDILNNRYNTKGVYSGDLNWINSYYLIDNEDKKLYLNPFLSDQDEMKEDTISSFNLIKCNNGIFIGKLPYDFSEEINERKEM